MLFYPVPSVKQGHFYQPPNPHPIVIQPPAFGRAAGALCQRSIPERGVSKACQQDIPTGAKGGMGQREFAHLVNITL